jgi:hypothetical protein
MVSEYTTGYFSVSHFPVVEVLVPTHVVTGAATLRPDATISLYTCLREPTSSPQITALRD